MRTRLPSRSASSTSQSERTTRPASVDRAALERDAVVDRRARTELHVAIGRAPATEAPDRTRADGREREAAVARQVFERLRLTDSRQVPGARKHGVLHREQTTRDECRVGQRSVPDREIDPLLGEIDHGVGESEVERQVWLLLRERREQRNDAGEPERNGGRDPERAARRSGEVRDGEPGLLDLRDHGLDASEVGRADLGRRDPARRALEEADAELFFERRNRARDRRGRDSALAGHCAEAAAAHHGDEDPKRFEVQLLRIPQWRFAKLVDSPWGGNTVGSRITRRAR